MKVSFTKQSRDRAGERNIIEATGMGTGGQGMNYDQIDNISYVYKHEVSILKYVNTKDIECTSICESVRTRKLLYATNRVPLSIWSI
jgi:hypothetical protein